MAERLDTLEREVERHGQRLDDHEGRLRSNETNIATLTAIQERQIEYDREWREENNDQHEDLRKVVHSGFSEVHSELGELKGMRRSRVAMLSIVAIVAVVLIVAAVATGNFGELLGVVADVAAEQGE